MPKYRNDLPHLHSDLFLTDGGLETTLCFLDGIELPEFAAFTMLESGEGIDRLNAYFEDYIEIARRDGRNFVLESVTWRANPDWAEKIGYTAQELDRFNRKSIETLVTLRDRFESDDMKIVISGCIGPRGDGYVPGQVMTAEEAQDYHRVQIGTFAQTEADMVSAITMNYAAEAIGIVRAATAAGLPAVISFTVETDGKLPTGQNLGDAISEVDRETGYGQGAGPAYYMINCAHPTHFASTLAAGGTWLERIGGIRANSSCKSHEELDNSVVLDQGNPVQLGREYRELATMLPNLRVVGGCCGTDHRHIDEISRSLAA